VQTRLEAKPLASARLSEDALLVEAQPGDATVAACGIRSELWAGSHIAAGKLIYKAGADLMEAARLIRSPRRRRYRTLASGRRA
jgi:hypothetical protein